MAGNCRRSKDDSTQQARRMFGHVVSQHESKEATVLVGSHDFVPEKGAACFNCSTFLPKRVAQIRMLPTAIRTARTK